MRNILLLIGMLIFTTSVLAWEYDDLEDTYNDAQFKKIFAEKYVPSCIWLNEYMRNSVLDDKVSLEKKECMSHNCDRAAGIVASTSQQYGSKMIYIGSGNYKANDFSDPLKKRYKKLFPNWKVNMQSQLENCPEQGALKDRRDKEDNLSATSSKSKGLKDTVKSIKSITGIFGKD